MTIEPRPASTMRGMAAWQNWNVPVRFTRSTRSQSSGATSWLCSKRRMPALFTRTSSRPASSVAAATARGAVAASPTSPARATMPAEAAAPFPMASTASASASSSRSTATTVAPSSTSRCAVARPMPDAAPVTMATRPSKRCIP